MIKAHWVPETKNWGDCFTPFLFEKLLGLEVEWADEATAEVFSCGSLLERIPENFPGWILGSGAGYSDTFCDLSSVRHPLLLRGPLAAKNCMFSMAPRFGDPGLLARMFSDANITKVYPRGIVPHCIDQELVKDWHERALVIDINSGIQEVINAIGSCEKIVSSSLHGLVIAHSLGIPCAWVKLSDGVLSEFKFHDYYSAYSLEVTPASSIEEAFGKCFSVDVAETFDAVEQTFMEFGYEASPDL